MNELRRNAYLQAMALDNLAPRFQLPGAAPSQRCAIPGPKPSRVPASARRSAQQPAPEPSQSAPEPAQSPPAPAGAPAKAPRPATLVLGSYASASALLVDSWPAARDWKSAPTPDAEWELANNLLRALGLLEHDERAQPEVFGWPGSGDAAAHQRAASFVARRGQGAQYLILLGEAAISHLLDASPLGMQALYCKVTLSAALSEAPRKLTLWRELSGHCPVAETMAETMAEAQD